MANEATVGGFIAETMALVRDRLPQVALYVAIVGGLAAVGVVFGLTEGATANSIGFGFSIDSEDTLASALFEIASAVVSVVGAYLLLAQYLAARGRLEGGGSRFWSFVGMSILSWIAIAIGFVLVIVPGVILMIRWSAASGFVIGGREGAIDSLGASWDATDGHSWAILAAALVLFLAALVVGAVVGALSGVWGDLTGAVAAVFLEAAAGALFMALGIAIYCLVHDDADRLEEVFA